MPVIFQYGIKAAGAKDFSAKLILFGAILSLDKRVFHAASAAKHAEGKVRIIQRPTLRFKNSIASRLNRSGVSIGGRCPTWP